MKCYNVTVQQIISILDRVKLPEVQDPSGAPTVIKIDRRKGLHNVIIKLIDPDVSVDTREVEYIQQNDEQTKQFDVDDSLLGDSIGSDNQHINYVIRDISSTHGRVMCVAEQLDQEDFRVVINSGCVKYKKMSQDDELLAWHVAECIIRTLVLHTGDPADHKRIDEVVDLFYDRLDGVIDGR